MRSNYKPLGEFIREVNKRDIHITVDMLLGVSIQKKFIPSIANIIGTDMSTYKIIKRNQFAYGPVTSRNWDKISIALLDTFNEAIVSQSYTVFEVIDTTLLLPEYLMMWFRRPEFDRYARFKSHGSAREVFDWEEMCKVELPIPSIEKQREIVAEYDVLINRINLNNTLIEKLEDTAQTLYKQWFVDFDFPDAEGNPYKSSGGEMIESEMRDIPKGWEYNTLGSFFPIVTWKKDANIATNNGLYPFFTCSKEYYLTDCYSFNSASILLTGNWDYNVKWYDGKFEAYQRTYVLSPYKRVQLWFLYYSIKYFLRDITNWDRWSVISFITKWMIEDYKIVYPKMNEEILDYFNLIIFWINKYELDLLLIEKTRNLLLAKIATI